MTTTENCSKDGDFEIEIEDEHLWGQSLVMKRVYSSKENDMPQRRSSMKSSMPPKGQQSGGAREGLEEALSGLTEALGGLVGGLGKTVRGVAKTATGTLEGVLGKLLGPLQQLKQQAQGGSEEASQAYGQAVSMLRQSSKEGRTDAQALLDQLGEALDQPPEERESK